MYSLHEVHRCVNKCHNAWLYISAWFEFPIKMLTDPNGSNHIVCHKINCLLAIKRSEANILRGKAYRGWL